MTIQEMHIALDLYVNKVAANVLDDFLPEEKDFYLNQATQEYIKAQHSMLKGETRSVQQEYVQENLRTLLKTEALALTTFSPVSGTWQATLPSDYLYYVYCSVRFSEVEKNARLVSFPELKRFSQTKTNKAIYREIPAALHNTLIIVMPDYTDTTPSTLAFTWVKVPVTLNFNTPVSSDLPVHTHHQLVRLAGDKILEDVKQMRPNVPAGNAG